MICFKQIIYPFEFFKGCLPQILLGPFLNTMPHVMEVLTSTCLIFCYRQAKFFNIEINDFCFHFKVISI